jgi:hypothetical protein
VLEEYTIEEQRSVVRFLWAKVLNAKDVHKEIFPVYGEKCLLRKAIHKWVRKRFADDEEVETEVRTWLIQESVGFDTLAKQWDKCISVGEGYVEK